MVLSARYYGIVLGRRPSQIARYQGPPSQVARYHQRETILTRSALERVDF